MDRSLDEIIAEDTVRLQRLMKPPKRATYSFNCSGTLVVLQAVVVVLVVTITPAVVTSAMASERYSLTRNRGFLLESHLHSIEANITLGVQVRPPFPPLRILSLLRDNRSQSPGSLETRQRPRHGKDMEKNFARYLI